MAASVLFYLSVLTAPPPLLLFLLFINDLPAVFTDFYPLTVLLCCVPSAVSEAFLTESAGYNYFK